MNDSAYIEFLESKIKLTDRAGIVVDAADLHPTARPHQVECTLWGLEMGRGGIFLDCGRGKSQIQIEILQQLQRRLGGKAIIVTELGVTHEFCDPEIGEGSRLGTHCYYITHQHQVEAYGIAVTNYERVRNGNIDLSQFDYVCLDEGSYIKNMASETTNQLQLQLASVKYKFVATATPSPNEYLEIINYAHVLGVCDRGQILTRFFQRNSTKAGELTIHPQHEEDFFLWVYSWAYFDDGTDADAPEMTVNWHEVNIGKAIDGGTDRDGQSKMFRTGGGNLVDEAKIKRGSIDVRVGKALDLLFRKGAESPDHCVIWHHLEDERKALNDVLRFHKGYADIYGSQDWDTRERRIIDFTKGDLQFLATKPEISGVGCNFHKHCSWAIFLGINHSWEQFYQAMMRLRPHLNVEPVTIDIIYTPEEYHIVQDLKQKWVEHDTMREKMREIGRKYGRSRERIMEEKKRSFMQKRKVFTGKNYTLVNNDCVWETAALPANSVDLIVSSFPFGNHYEYTDKYNDFGHNQTNQDFILQLDFLIPELLRVLKPGRIAAVHLKNRIHYGSVTGLGFSTVHRFTHLVADCMEKHGFHTLGWHYITTDVVAENNQTYRLGYTEMTKDSTKMGAGIPEEIWIFRKAPTSNANAYADEPVTHDEQYSLAHWQIDADCFWKDGGNRYLTPAELNQWGLDKLMAWWKRFNKSTVYEYDKHVALLKRLDDKRKLSRTFTTLPLQSNSDFIWNDVNRMRGLNMEQSRRKERNHICPMPFDEVDRLIELYSNTGDTVMDIFGGLGTTGVRALKKGRKAILFELNEEYAKAAARYLKETEMKNNLPTLFDRINDEIQIA
jgi:DNA modification methylase